MFENVYLFRDAMIVSLFGQRGEIFFCNFFAKHIHEHLSGFFLVFSFFNLTIFILQDSQHTENWLLELCK